LHAPLLSSSCANLHNHRWTTASTSHQTTADEASAAEEQLQAQCEQLQAEALHREQYLQAVISCAEWSESRIVELDVKLITLRQRCERSDKKLVSTTYALLE
jgi:hypothetical protein